MEKICQARYGLTQIGDTYKVEGYAPMTAAQLIDFASKLRPRP